LLFFLKTIRGVKEWEHGSLLPLTHSFYYYLFIILNVQIKWTVWKQFPFL